MKGAAYGISDGICDRTPGGACRTPGSMDHQIDGVVGLHCSQIKVWLAGSVVKAVLYMRPTAAQCGQCSQHKDEDFQGNMDKQHILYFTVQHTKNVHLLGFHNGSSQTFDEDCEGHAQHGTLVQQCRTGECDAAAAVTCNSHL